MFIHGISIFIISPIVGWVRDYTQDYIITFHVLTFFMALCAVPWVMEMVYVKLAKKNKH